MYLQDADWQPEFFGRSWCLLVPEVAEGTDSPQRRRGHKEGNGMEIGSKEWPRMGRRLGIATPRLKVITALGVSHSG